MFIFISNSSALPFSFLSWPLSFLCLGDERNTSLSTLQTFMEVSDGVSVLSGKEREKRRMEKETYLAQE